MKFQIIVFGVLALLTGTSLFAQPVRCTPGYQDSSCASVLLNAPQVAPTCTAAPGWVTVTPAKWVGSKWLVPSCNYTPPPTCPSGFEQIAPPSWTGTNWVAPACAFPTPELRPEGVLNGKTFTLMSPAAPNGSSWSSEFTVNGFADRITFVNTRSGVACSITGPGSSCSWGWSGEAGFYARPVVEWGPSGSVSDLVTRAFSGSGGLDSFYVGGGAGRSFYNYARQITMTADGSLILDSYYTGSDFDFYQSSMYAFTTAARGMIPASQLGQVSNGSSVTYGFESANY